MKAAVTTELGSLDNIKLADVPAPEVGPGRLRLRVAAVGLGFVDGLIALGRYQLKPPLPFIPGNEIAGTVEAVGTGVTAFQVGDHVAAGTFGGGLAELCVVSADAAHRVPPGVSSEAAAALIVNYATAFHGLADRAAIRPGETLLVLGAAGGVGSAAVEVGKQLGAYVIACASSEEKREFARALGANAVVASDAPDWRQDLKALTRGRGVDVVFDPVSGELFEPAFRSLSWRGRHLVVGFAGGTIPALPANLPLLKGGALVGVDLRQLGQLEPDAARGNLAKLMDWAGHGRLKIPVGARFTLDDARQALAATMARGSLGKVTVTVPGGA